MTESGKETQQMPYCWKHAYALAASLNANKDTAAVLFARTKDNWYAQAEWLVAVENLQFLNKGISATNLELVAENGVLSGIVEDERNTVAALAVELGIATGKLAKFQADLEQNGAYA